MEEFKPKIEQRPEAVEKLRKIFDTNKDKRICIVGSSCVGKTTLLKYLPDAIDMDDFFLVHQKKELNHFYLKKNEHIYVVHGLRRLVNS